MLIFSIIAILMLATLFASILLWDKGRRSFILAVRSLWLHRLRAFLSVLGIIIGTGAVISLMAFGEGSMQDALDDIRRLGANNIMVRSVKPTDESNSSKRSYIAIYGLTYTDFDKIATIPTVTRMVPMRIFPQEARRGYKSVNSRVVSTIPDYMDIHNVEMKSGRFLVSDDEVLLRNVVVLGSELANRLFPFENPRTRKCNLGLFFTR